MRKVWWLAAVLLMAGAVSAQETKEESAQQEEVKAEDVKVEKVVKSTVHIVMVDEDGKVIKKTISSDGEGKDGEKGQALSYTMKDGVIQIGLPDGTVKKLELAKLGKAEGVANIIELRAVPELMKDGKLNIAADVEIKAVGEMMKGIESELHESLKGLEATIQGLDPKAAEEIQKQISIAIASAVPETSHSKLMRLGKAAIVLSDDDEDVAEAIAKNGRFEFRVQREEDGGKPMRTFRIVRSGKESDGEEEVEITKTEKVVVGEASANDKILAKLDAIMQRIDKLEQDVAQLKKDN